MPAAPLSHPDRLAASLAHLAAARAARPEGAFAAPGAGAADCRIDLKLLQWRALAAAARSPAARAHLAGFAPQDHPDLWAGTVQDGVARGFSVRLEEAVLLAEPGDAAPHAPVDQAMAVATGAGERTLSGKELRKHKDLLVASAGPRVRFTKKHGLLLVDRADGLHSSNCLWFEARRDIGTLDGFAADEAERPRLFSAQFLKPVAYTSGGAATRLTLQGRLGRGPIGWPCRIVVRGDAERARLSLDVHVDNRVADHRLRVRWLGIEAHRIEHECQPVREIVANDHGGFVADTLLRSCTTLLVDGARVPVPMAACQGPLRHTFHLG